jgi:hypothetical protein
MCIRRETREMARRSLAFSPVSKPHAHISYMLRQCTSIVYIRTLSVNIKFALTFLPVSKARTNKLYIIRQYTYVI